MSKGPATFCSEPKPDAPAGMGVNAGSPVKVLTALVVLQVEPPSTEVLITTWSSPVLALPRLKLEACSQTTYSWPLLGSMDDDGTPSPTRISWPGLGSWTPTVCICAMTTGALQVRPPSVDLTIAAVSWVLLALLGWVIQSVTSKRVLPPLRGSTRMMLPIVWSRCAEGKMVCGALQLRPPSRVRL